MDKSLANKRRKQREATRRWRATHKEKERQRRLERYKANREINIQQNAEWYRKNKDWRKLKDRRVWLKKNYGITPAQYDEMFKAQEGCCAICGTLGGDTQYTRLVVDHSHETKKVRALLCRKCNLMVGYANDKPEILVQGAKYLEKHNG